MVITLTVANEMGRNEDSFYLSQGRTIESANNNMYRYLCKQWHEFEYQSETTDVSEFLHNKFARWQNGRDTWKDEDSWTNRFPDFTFIRPNRAGIIEISQEMYDEILAGTCNG